MQLDELALQYGSIKKEGT